MHVEQNRLSLSDILDRKRSQSAYAMRRRRVLIAIDKAYGVDSRPMPHHSPEAPEPDHHKWRGNIHFAALCVLVCLALALAFAALAPIA
jgi:hypothetical protein